MALTLNSGVVKVGAATHFAAVIPSVFTSPITKATAYPTTTPRKIEMRPMKPREKAANPAIARRVIVPSIGPLANPPLAAPARLKPITITMVPVTTGGNIQLIQPVPTARAIKPTSANMTPVATTPPSATAMLSLFTDAAMGARKAKDDPR